MKTWFSCYLLLLSMLCVHTSVLANTEPTSAVPVDVELRQYGYHLGDFVKLKTRFTLPDSMQLDPLSIPLKGPVNSWFDLHDVQLERHATSHGSEYFITYVWQIFVTVENAQSIVLPTVTLQTLPIETAKSDVATPAYIFAEPQHISVSPVFPSVITDEQPRPFIKPPKFDTKTPLWFAVSNLIIALALFVFWLWFTDKLTFWPRNPGPLTLLNRQLSKQNKLTQQHLRQIHQTLALVATQSIYPNTLPKLYQQAPYLLAVKDDIDTFFHQSWAATYIDPTQTDAISLEQTLKWIKTSSVQERLYRLQYRHHINQ